MFQHKIQKSVQCKDFLSFAIFYVLEASILICIDLLACAQVIIYFFSEIWRRRILPVFAKFLVLQFP
jgi:hypothetical protein